MFGDISLPRDVVPSIIIIIIIKIAQSLVAHIPWSWVRFPAETQIFFTDVLDAS